MVENNSANKRLAVNTITLYVRMLVLMLITLYTSRVILKNLGATDFGIYNVVGGLVVIVGSISSSLTASSNRFIAYALGKESIEIQQKTFSTLLNIHLVLALLTVVLAETIGVWFLETQLVIPSDRMFAARLVFQMTVLSTALLFLSFPYCSLIVAHERMNIYAYITIIDVVLKLIIVLSLEILPYDKLVCYSVLIFLTQILIQIVYVIYCKYSFKECKYQFVLDRKIIKSVSKFTGWIMIGNVSSIIYVQGVNVLLNIFYGPLLNAARAISMQVQSAVLRFTDSFQTALKPQIIKEYAVNNEQRVKSLVIYGTKYSYYLLLVISLPLIIEIDYILDLWLVEAPKYSGILVNLILACCFARCIASPLMLVMQADGKIQKTQICDAIILLLIIPVSYLAYFICEMPPYYIMIIALIFEIINNVVKIKLSISYINSTMSTFFKRVVIPLFNVTFFSSTFPILIHYFYPDSSIVRLFLVVIISLFSVILSCYIFGLDQKEKGIVSNKAKFVLQKVNKLW